MSFYKTLNGFCAQFLIIFMTALGVFAPSSVRASNPFCGVVLGEGSTHFKSLLISKGLDPDHLSFQIGRDSSGIPSRIRAFYNSESVGALAIDVTTLEGAGQKSSRTLYISHSAVLQKYRGKGIGSLLYLAAAHDLYRQTGESLGSSFDPSDDAQAVWEAFRSKRWASMDSPPYAGRFIFQAEFVKKNLQEVADFVETHSENPKP